MWAKTYMKTGFMNVIFSDECRATLDGPDGFCRGWLNNGQRCPTCLRRQQGGGGVMFWAALHGKKLIGPFRIENGVKMNSSAYINLLNSNLLPYINYLLDD